MEDETLNSLRYCFQRVLVPCVVITGVLGNFVTVIVLTRRRMRCSTNVYLTALAVADIVFLLFNFILSLQHYPNINRPKYELYWRTYGLSHWLCDASSYTSIYLTVSFTIERYIAVCHPIRGQVLCTESRAKKVIAVVVILCFLLTGTTSFEYQLTSEERYINKETGEKCPLPINDTSEVSTIYPDSSFDGYVTDDINDNEMETTMSNLLLPEIDNSKNFITDYSKNYDNFNAISNVKILEKRSIEIDEKNINKNTRKMYERLVPEGYIEEFLDSDTIPATTTTTSIDSDTDEDSIILTPQLNQTSDELCIFEVFLQATDSVLGMNNTYRNIFYPMSSIIFVFLPLILLATFNCFLVAAVRRSQKMRHKMTNTRQSDTSSTQENKMTVTLIAVVVLFLVCQTPTAIFLIYTPWDGPDVSHESINLNKAVGNLLNFLVILNAACNFLLYCALSDKYRQTVKSIIFPRKKQKRSTATSRFSRYASTRGTSNRSSTKVTEFNSYGNRNRIPSISLTSRPSITPTEFERFDISRGDSEASVEKNNSAKNKDSPQSNRFLKPSNSTNSLTRSRSLTMPLKTRHSPDCKLNPSNF